MGSIGYIFPVYWFGLIYTSSKLVFFGTRLLDAAVVIKSFLMADVKSFLIILNLLDDLLILLIKVFVTLRTWDFDNLYF